MKIRVFYIIMISPFITNYFIVHLSFYINISPNNVIATFILIFSKNKYFINHFFVGGNSMQVDFKFHIDIRILRLIINKSDINLNIRKFRSKILNMVQILSLELE